MALSAKTPMGALTYIVYILLSKKGPNVHCIGTQQRTIARNNVIQNGGYSS